MFLLIKTVVKRMIGIVPSIIGKYYGIKFTSQWFQDLIAFLYLKKNGIGFYIDIGANDGITFSNTYVFEQLGWKGICIEPQPDIFLELQKNRKCSLYNVAIADRSSEFINFVKVNGPNMLSGLDDQMSEDHKKRIINEGGSIEYIKVKTLSFDDMMKDHPEQTFMDFLSIDTEGGELSILKAIDFVKYRFGLISIENNEPGDTLVKFMQARGYKTFIKLRGDIMFIQNSK
ncbi:hypothetical protein FACS1894147_04590 [Spirochaetia bacterium]|nr:hypothetical protein FACS1894147_04590 [Spirochaetia bacterium]